MFKTSASALLISTALLTGGALAQTSSAPGTAGSGGMPTSATPGAASGQFMTEQAMGQFRASKLVGVDIYGTDNQKIGDVNEILMDGSGSAKAVVIGVGGFLGIGEKNVAVPFSAVEWVNTPMRGVTTTGAAGTTAGSGTVATGSSTGMATTTAGTTATMGSTTAGPGSTATPANINGTAATGPAGTVVTTTQRSPDEMAAYNGYPDHGVLRMSKADLQNAPTFRYYSQVNSASGAATNATTAPMTAPAGTPRQ